MIFDGECDDDNRLVDAIEEGCDRLVEGVKVEESRGGF